MWYSINTQHENYINPNRKLPNNIAKYTHVSTGDFGIDIYMNILNTNWSGYTKQFGETQTSTATNNNVSCQTCSIDDLDFYRGPCIIPDRGSVHMLPQYCFLWAAYRIFKQFAKYIEYSNYSGCSTTHDAYLSLHKRPFPEVSPDY